MKKNLKKIIGTLLVIVMCLTGVTPLAQSADETGKAELACQDLRKKLDTVELLQAWNESDKDYSDYEETFEAAQMAYHNYVGCMFDFAEKTIMKSDGAEDGGGMAANTMNTGGVPLVGGTIDWMTPDQACLSEEELKKIIQATEPIQLFEPIINAHTEYKNLLRALAQNFQQTATPKDTGGRVLGGLPGLIAKNAQLSTIGRQRELEIESSLIAIDLMFTSLKELRLSFVMHVNFQCTLKFLDKYRLALQELRSVIQGLPNQLENASVNP